MLPLHAEVGLFPKWHGFFLYSSMISTFENMWPPEPSAFGIKSSSVASPICQEGKVKESSWFWPFLPDFSSFFLIFPDFFFFFCSFFPDFWQIFVLLGVALCPPWPPSGYATDKKNFCTCLPGFSNPGPCHSVPCFKFLCVVGLTHRLANSFTGMWILCHTLGEP